MNEKYADVAEAIIRAALPHKIKCACIMFEDGGIIDLDCRARCKDDSN